MMCGGSHDLQQLDAACLKNMAKNNRNYFNLSDPQHGVENRFKVFNLSDISSDIMSDILSGI